jgi:hypothetical protein
MVYSKIRSMQGFWILGKISDHQAFPLDAEDIDHVVEQLNQCARFRAKMDREKMAKVIFPTMKGRMSTDPSNFGMIRSLEIADALIAYLTE